MRLVSKLTLKQTKLLTLLIGSGLIAAWTMLRFMIKTTNFDLVGQQELAHQWLQGFHSGAHIGPTNYVIKMIVLYMPADLLHLTPRWSLIGITLLVNIITFIGIVWVLEKIWLEFHARVPRSFYVAMLWLAAMAGSMYWIQFSNSRNLEVVIGLISLWLIIKARSVLTVKRMFALILVSSVALFADPLQLYMTIIPALLFTTVYILLHKGTYRDKTQLIVKLFVTIVVGFVLSKLYMMGITALYHPEFMVVADQTKGYGLRTILFDGGVGAVKQTARLYVGGYELGRYVEALNLLFAATVAVLSLWYVVKKQIPLSLMLLVATLFIVDATVYTISGQSLQTGTARYMIMTVPMFALVVSLVLANKVALQKLLVICAVLLIALNGVVVTSLLFTNWDLSFTKDAHTKVVIAYMSTKKITYGYASLDVAIPADYLSQNHVRLLPLSCEVDGNLHKSVLFFDKAFVNKAISENVTEVPVIFDGTSIVNSPFVCTSQRLIDIVGEPIRQDRLADGSIVLFFTHEQLLKL